MMQTISIHMMQKPLSIDYRIMNFSFLQEATDHALQFQWNYVNHCLKCGTNYPGMTAQETEAFRDAIHKENEIRWNSYQKEKMQKMLIEIFGENAIVLK